MSQIDELERMLNRDEPVRLLPDGRVATGFEARALNAEHRIVDLESEVARLTTLINNPQTADFIEAVKTEAAHQRERWGSGHDGGKADADWFWLIGYLAGKALHKPEKQLHHIITTAAACLNWHRARTTDDSRMRPGIEPPDETRRAHSADASRKSEGA